MKKLCSTRNLSKEAWLRVRKGGLGGSDIAGVVGMSKFSTPISVYLDKIGSKSFAGNEATYWGEQLEDLVAKEFVKRMSAGEGSKYCPAPGPWKIQKVNAVLQGDEPWMLANLDGLLTLPDGSKAILECKTGSHFSGANWEDDAVPDAYWCQCMWYMGVTRIPRCFVAALIGGQKFLVRELRFDGNSFDMLKDKGREFWKLVESRTPPALDGSDDAEELLQHLYGQSASNTVPLQPVAGQLIEQYEQAKAEEKAASERKKFAQQHLMYMLGTAESGFYGSHTVTWKPQERNSLDTKALREAYPDLARQFTKTSSSRVFRLSSKMEDN